MTFRCKPVALGAVIALSVNPAFAETADEAVVVVTASRFAGVEWKVPANVTVLTSRDIAATPAANLPDLLTTRAGIEVTSLYGSQAADAAISLRGFGENSSLRTLVIVDGRRLDAMEFVTPNWASIPLDSIERIEILRGSNSVMYGDQAVAGVINIITHRGKENAADIAVTLGSFNSKTISASLSRNDTPLRFALTAAHNESDEYRRNNAHRNTTGSARVAKDFANGEIYAEFGAGELLYELPGFVTPAQYRNDPRASETNDSWFKRENQYFRPGIRWQLSAELEAALELSTEKTHNRSWLSSWPSYRDVEVSSTSLTPRLSWQHGLAGVPSTTVIGFDWSDASLDQDRAASPAAAINQRISIDRTGSGFYVNNTTEPAAGWAITLGARQHRMHSRATDSTVPGVTEATEKKNASEIGATWKPANSWKLFAKLSQTFRYPVLDEWTTFAGFASPVPRPESGRGKDVGAEWRAGGHSVQVTAYELDMKDEIAWNNATFQNENLQKTRHRGIEIDSRWKLADNWRLNLNWTGKSATFAAGTNDGNDIPLVPQTRWGAMLSWQGGAWGQHALRAEHVGTRHTGGDEANALARLPAYTTLNWQSGWLVDHWDISLRVNNLTNKKYAPSAFNYGFGFEGYYPANPRSAYLTARYRF